MLKTENCASISSKRGNEEAGKRGSGETGKRGNGDMDIALRYDVTLAEATFQQVRVPCPRSRPREKLKRVIADGGYDSDTLRELLRKRAIEPIAHYRKNNKRAAL